MLGLAFLFALQGAFICGGHMVKSEIQQQQHGVEAGAGQIFIDSVQIEDASVADLYRSLAFYPPRLDFGTWAVGTARSHVVTLVNKNVNKSVHLSSISGKTPDFYSSFFEDKVVPPQGNTTFNVVFLPRTHGDVETSLLIHTSFGQARLPVKGEGRECPYRLRPLVGIKTPFNSTIKPEIYMYNPHSKPIQILEVYSSGGQFQLELPSGGQEGPQALWEIPPFTSKPIIRIRFHGTQAGNHTAYIRIKINNVEDDSNEDNILVVPVEFEVLGNYGLYTANPIIDFGKVASDGPARTMKVDLINSGKDRIDIVEYKLKNVDHFIQLQESNLTLILNPKDAKDNIQLQGELLIKMQNKMSNQYLELPVEIRAEIYKGSMDFQKNVTVFITGAKNYTRKQRSFIVKNNFGIPIAINKLSVDKNETEIFKISDFNPKILAPSETSIIFMISILNESANFISPLRIETNLSIYELPIIVCTGLLQQYTSIDAVNLTALPDDVLDFGTVPYGDFSHFGIVLIRNPNPVAIQLAEWNFTNPKNVYYQSMFLGCSMDPKIPKLNEKSLQDRFKFCLNLPPSQTGAFELAVQSYNVKSFTGAFNIKTEIEEISIGVKFVTVMGRLEVDQTRLHFSDCFPGKRCSADISIHSTFLKPMRVKSITVSVPGLVFEYHTVSNNGLPEIAANSVTDIGKIHFDPKSVCSKKCYIPQEGDLEAEPFKKEEIDFNTTELRRRTESFRRFKWNLQTITFTLDTTKVRRFEFNSSVDIVWPKLVKEQQIFSPIEVGQNSNSWIYITNPSSENLYVEISLSDPSKAKSTTLSLPLEVVEICVYCYLTDQNVFSLGHKGTFDQVHIIKPNSFLAVPILFTGEMSGTFSTLLHIRNNLTLYEAVWLTGKAVQPQFRFGNRKPGSSTPLLFEINEKHLTSCERNKESAEQVFVLTKRTFTARNTGEVPIRIEAFKIGDRVCEGYGFKILDCFAFELAANSSRKIDIAFTPDFTMTRITRPLVLETNLSYAVNYTLLATVPVGNIEQCAKSLHRPFWEVHMKKMSVGVLTVAFMFVLIAAFLDSDKVLKDHVQNMSKDKGPMQPLLDLRSIGVKQNSLDESGGSNNTSNNEKITKPTTCSSVRKRNTKRAASSQTSNGRDKSWAEELAKKLSSPSKSSDSSSSNTSWQSSPSPAAKPSQSQLKQSKEEKQSPPKRNSRELSESVSVEKISNDKVDVEENPKKPEVKCEPVQNDVKKGKSAVKKSKSLPGSGNSEQQVDVSREENSNSFDRGTERNQNRSKQSKEKYDLPASGDKKGIQTVEQKSPSNDSSTVQCDSPNKLTSGKSHNVQKKYGKTPGRERKKETAQTKRAERNKAPKFKNTAFQFPSPMAANGVSPFVSSNPSVWDPNQATFSHVVAQSSSINDHLLNGFHKGFDPQDTNNNGHDWNEADLKNHETFGCDIEPKPNFMDLGPIGTKKSPSSTPSWEPLSQGMHRPIPNMNAGRLPGSSFFSTNFQVAPYLDSRNDSQYMGGTSNLLDRILSENQSSHWQTNDFLSTIFQPQEQPKPARPVSDWPIENGTWSPMGYQNEPPLLLQDKSNVWNRPSVIRPPPGLTPKAGSPYRKIPNNPVQSLQPCQNTENDDKMNNAQPFDPFNSLLVSSIWSEPWTKNDNK